MAHARRRKLQCRRQLKEGYEKTEKRTCANRTPCASKIGIQPLAELAAVRTRFSAAQQSKARVAHDETFDDLSQAAPAGCVANLAPEHTSHELEPERAAWLAAHGAQVVLLRKTANRPAAAAGCTSQGKRQDIRNGRRWSHRTPRMLLPEDQQRTSPAGS
jgi:hypothetical protein